MTESHFGSDKITQWKAAHQYSQPRDWKQIIVNKSIVTLLLEKKYL